MVEIVIALAFRLDHFDGFDLHVIAESRHVVLNGLLGRHVPAINTPDGIRAVNKTKPVDPGGVERYLEGKFGEALPVVREAMRALATAFKPEQLAQEAFGFYEQFRPGIPEGVGGWGAKGELDLNRVRALAPKK